MLHQIFHSFFTYIVPRSRNIAACWYVVTGEIKKMQVFIDLKKKKQFKYTLIAQGR